nr:unnamed protein product [Spirometra erinaceieuropaei]
MIRGIGCLEMKSPRQQSREVKVIQATQSPDACPHLTYMTPPHAPVLERPGGSGGDMIVVLFTEDVTDFSTFYGKGSGSRAFFGSPIYNLIPGVFNKWGASHVSDRQKLEDAFKNVFKRAQDRQQRRCNKASTSGLQNDAPLAKDPDRTPNYGNRKYPWEI